MISSPDTIKRRILDFSLEQLGLVPAKSSPGKSLDTRTESLLLPAYPGEMGIEIRYFLGRVEPWLKAGWRILARRPELYPAGTAIRDDALFAAEDALFRRFGADRLALGPHVRQPGRGRCNRLRAFVARQKARRLQEEWRGLLGRRIYGSEARPWTRWDKDLAKVSTEFAVDRLWKHGDVVPPTYLPPAFDSDGSENRFPDHVGVQMRAVSFSLDPRNSHVEEVLCDANSVAEHLCLPLLVYGHPTGCVLPDGMVTTASLGDSSLLTRELGYLRNCRVMLAPNSGWADLMCWLRVPVLVEERGGRGVFDMMAPFRPRLLLRRRALAAKAQVDALLRGESEFRDLGSAHVDESSLRRWVRGR